MSETESLSPEPPDESPARVNWSAMEILAVLFFVYGIWPIVASQALLTLGVYDSIYGPEIVKLAESKEDADADAAKIARVRLNLWAVALAFPLQVLTVPYLFKRFSNTSPEEIGITRREGFANLRRGVETWAIVTPIVILVNAGAVLLWKRLAQVDPTDHPLVSVAAQRLMIVEWVLLIATACVVAPILEELVFRGVLQPWASGSKEGSFILLLFAGLLALSSQHAHLMQTFRGEGSALVAFAPVGFVLLLVPLVAFYRDQPKVAGLLATSALFAAVHSFAWPSPIGLFLLGIGLGHAFKATRSLVAPIVIHSLFNAVSCLVLFT